jgi:hypothetical protein
MTHKLFPDIPAFLHLFLIFKHHIASLAPGAAVEVQGVSLSTTRSMDVQGVFHKIIKRKNSK